MINAETKDISFLSSLLEQSKRVRYIITSQIILPVFVAVVVAPAAI